MVGNTNYNFEYIILAAEKQGATELNWTGFYTSVPGWDVDKLRPDDWLYIKMTEKTRIVYRPIQPFDLSVDPVSKFVEFADYEPADRRSKFSKLRTLREITAGAWPAAPTPDETLIATQLDMVAIAKAAEEAETGRKLLTRTTAPSPKVDDAMSVDLTAAATTTTGTTTTAEATAAADANLAPTLFSLTAMEAAIKKQVESTLVELIKKPDESTTVVVTAPVTTVASTAAAVGDQQVVATTNNKKKKPVKREKQQQPAALPLIKPLTEGALALMRQEMRSELLREFEAKTEKQLQQHQQQLQQQFQQQQQQQQQQKQREAGFNGYRMRAYRRSSRSKSRTPPPPLNGRSHGGRKSRKRSYSNERCSYRSRSRSRETRKESGNHSSEPAPVSTIESKAVELLRLGLEQMSQKGVSSSGEDKKQTGGTSEMLVQQQQEREKQFQLQQQQLEQQQQQMLALQQQQQQLQRQLLVQKSTTAMPTGSNRRPTGRGAHNTFYLPGPEPAMFLPLPKSKSLQQLSSSSRPPLPKRQDLDETYEGVSQWREPSSPDVTPERFHKGSAGQNQHYLWLQFQHQQRLQQQQKEEMGMELNGISRLKRS